FVAQQSLTLSAAEGARAALQYQLKGNATDALAARVAATCPTASSMLAPMVATAQCSASSSSCNSGMLCVTVQLAYSYTSNPLIPSLPLLGDVLPKTLTSSSTIQLNPVNIL
ncbi:MAG TPA: pilus assembly protein, partial [Paraburkholderia sp.]|nr:pilus assembly protein [Paraburkholderia sp.]